MARKAKAATVAADTAPKKTPKEAFEYHYPICVAAKLEQEKAAKAASAANSAFRNAVKAAKRDGIHSDALVQVLALRKEEPDDVTLRFRSINSYARWANLPIGAQLGLFDDGETVGKKVDDDKLGAAGVNGNGADGKPGDDFDKPTMSTEARIARAKTQGFDDGSEGKTANNAWPEGSPEALAYTAEYMRAQEVIASKMGPKRGRGADSRPSA